MLSLFNDKKLDRADRIQLVISYSLQLIIFVAIIITIYEKQWLAAFLTSGILVLTLMPAMIQRNYKVYLPIEFHFVTILFIFASLFLGEIHTYYTRFWWWDVVLHTGSGILLGIAGFVLIYVLNQQEKIHLNMKPVFIALFSLAFAILIGAAWEIFEFSMDSFFGLNMQKSGLADTMWDLIVDFLGAGFISISGYFYIKDRESLLFDRLVHKFIRRNPKLFKGK